MKKFIQPGLVLFIGAAVALAVTGCATTKAGSQALVCPDCKMVEVTVENPAWGDYPTTETTTQMEHTCPGCQGALKTFFKEGKFQHKCSVCAQGPFTCPVNHRW